MPSQVVPRALRPDQAAAYCGLSVSAFRRLVADGPPPRRPAPRTVVYLREELDAWIETWPSSPAPAHPATAASDGWDDLIAE